MDDGMTDHEKFIRHAIDLSRAFEENPDYTPFGAVVVLNNRIVGEGVSSVVPLHDPTAHAEVLAIRDACNKLGTHLLTGATVYASGYPCPLCLITCYWTQASRIFHAGTLEASHAVGFEDTDLYLELTLPASQRSIPVESVDGPYPERVASLLNAWHEAVSGGS